MEPQVAEACIGKLATPCDFWKDPKDRKTNNLTCCYGNQRMNVTIRDSKLSNFLLYFGGKSCGCGQHLGVVKLC